MSIKIGPVRVVVFGMDGKEVFSGYAQSATLSPNNGECALTLASNARSSLVSPAATAPAA